MTEQTPDKKTVATPAIASNAEASVNPHAKASTTAGEIPAVPPASTTAAAHSSVAAALSDNSAPLISSPAEETMPMARGHAAPSAARHSPAPRLAPSSVQNLPNAGEVPAAPMLPAVPKRRRVWRFLRSLAMPFVLGGAGFVILALLGGQGLSSFQAWLSAHWIALTLMRFGIYAVIAFIAAPYLLRRVKSQRLEQLAQYYETLAQDKETPVQHLWQLAEQMQKVANAKLPCWLIPSLLLAIEVLFVQLLFLLK